MFKYLFLFLFLFSVSKAEVVSKFEVTGNKRFSPETIKVYGEIEIGKNYSSFEVNEILKNLYETNFFEDVDVNLSNGILKVIVKEYPSIYNIDFQGEKSNTVKKKILKELQLKEQESFIENKLSEDINLIKKIYNSLGYNFIKVESKIERFDDNRLNLFYVINKGNKTYITDIKFIGDKKIKDKRLRDVIASEEHKFWKFLSKNTFLKSSNIDLDKRLLLSYYKSLGYYDVQVLSEYAQIISSEASSLVYTINAGKRYKINKISLNVSNVLDKKKFEPLLKEYNSLLGKYYSPFKVKKILDRLDSLIVENDLQFIEQSVNEILDSKSIEIKINIYEGTKQIVKKINIIGNTITDEAVIRGELLLDEGDPFNKLKLEKSVAKIKSRGLFSKVETKIPDSEIKDEKIVTLTVEETPTGEISAGAGIGTTGGSVAFSIKENNWLGKGIAVTTNLNLTAETFSGGVGFTNPNYNFSGNAVSFDLQNSSNDRPKSGFKNNITSVGVGTKFEQYRDIYISSGVSLAYDDLKVDNTASSELQKQKGTFTNLDFNYAVTTDKRDKVYAPTDGHVASFGQTIPIYADTPYLKNNLSVSKYKAFTSNYIGSLKFYASAINGLNDKDVRLSKRLFLPSSRLRGFEKNKVGPKDGEDYVGGNYTSSVNFALNLPNFLPESTKTDVGLFLDFGNVWSVDYSSSIDDSNKIRSSAGINTSWISPVGPLSFVISQNISKASTDITETFNFKLGTTF